MLKKVAAVPSGRTKLNGPVESLLAAPWNESDVFTGSVVGFQESVFQTDANPGAGFASLAEDVKVPAAGWM